MATISRQAYAEMYGPTTGDRDAYPAEFVNNGAIRIAGDSMNMWASDPGQSLPQSPKNAGS